MLHGLYIKGLEIIMGHKIIEDIKKNKREDWASLAKEKWTDTRIWLQEHGEWSFGIGVLTGAIIVLAFEFVIALVVVAFLLGLGVWYFAGSNEVDAAVAGADGDSTSTSDTSSKQSFASEPTADLNSGSNGKMASENEKEDSAS